MDNNNFFDALKTIDDINTVERESEKKRLQGEKLDNLIHKLFSQTPEGVELLEIWKEYNLVMSPSADAGMDSIEIGIREGMKRFIRNIILTCKKVEAR